MKNAPQTEENPPPAPHPLDALRAYVAQCVAAYTGHLGRPGGIWSAEDYAKAVASKECLALATEALAGSRNNEGDTDMTMTEAMHDPHARALALAPTLTEEQRHWLGRLADGGLDVPAFGYLDGPECKSLAATGMLSCTSEADMFGELLRYEVTPLGLAVLAVLDAPTGEPEADCAICGWPLYASTAQGCTAASCSYRPNVGSAEWLRIQKRKEALASKPSEPEQAAPSHAPHIRRVHVRKGKYGTAILSIDVDDKRITAKGFV